MTFTGAYVLRDVLGTHYAVPVAREAGAKWRCFELPDEGAWLWRALERGEEDVAERYDARFGVAVSKAEEVLADFVGSLAALGVVELRP